MKESDQVSSEPIALIKSKIFQKEKLNGDYCTSRLEHMQFEGYCTREAWNNGRCQLTWFWDRMAQ